MMGLKELKGKQDLIDSINWEMTPEEAVRLYLEWGNNWSRGYNMVRSKNDIATYFVLNTWEKDPVIYLIQRSSEGAIELARIEIPEELQKQIKTELHSYRGIFSVDDHIRKWLEKELDVT